MTTILIVDDHVLVRRGLRQVIADDPSLSSATVREASSAAEAREAIAQGEPSLVLLDIRLPGESGIDLLAEFRSRWPAMPVLMLTAFPEHEFAVRALRLGAAGYVTKESAADELVAAIRKVLAGGRYVSAELVEQLADALAGEEREQAHPLSARELEVLRHVAKGRSQREIASLMGVSEKTVATYRARIAEKLGISTIVELTRYALLHKLAD